MALDINLLLRKWTFDLSTESLGIIRIANFKFAEFFGKIEDDVRAGKYEGRDLARMLVGQTARRLTGDEEVDKECNAPLIDEREINLISENELDAFSDKLINGRLQVAKAGVVPAPTPVIAESGCVALPLALIAHSDAVKANSAKMQELIKSSTSSLSAMASINDKTLAEWTKQDSLVRLAMGQSLGGAFAQTIADFKHTDLTGVLGKPLIGEIPKTLAQYEQDKRLIPSSLHTDLAGFLEIGNAERIAIASGNHRNLSEQLRTNELEKSIRGWDLNAIREHDTAVFPISRPLHIFQQPKNPVEDTNKIMTELLEHQKGEAAKNDVGAVESDAISKSSLLYTKLGFWLALFVFIAPLTWAYFEQKADAATAKNEAEKTAKTAAVEIAKQRAEINALTLTIKELKLALPRSKEVAIQPDMKATGKQ